jgi:hypothetical protein
MNLPVTNAQWCIGSSAYTLGLQHLKFLDMGASIWSPNGTRVVHHGTDELLIQQNTIHDEEIALPVSVPSFSPDICVLTR